MWKHKNFINLQLCAGETWVLNENINSFMINDGYTTSFVCDSVSYSWFGGERTSIFVPDMLKYDDTLVYISGSWENQKYRIVTFETAPTGDLLTWLQANGTKQSTPQPTLTFKHFYDAGTIGSGTYKFRHYSQQEPSSGNVIKAGTYKWVDTPDIQGITDIIGENGGIEGQFKSSDINFDIIEFSVILNLITYYPHENFTSLIGNQEVTECGYLDGQWKVASSSDEIREVPALQTFTILEDINLTSEWNEAEIEQAILTWFTANTTKLS